MIKRYFHGRRGISLPTMGVVSVMIIVAVSLFFVLQSNEQPSDTTTPPSAASVSPTQTTNSGGATDATSESPATASSTPPADETSDSIQKQMIELIEAYYLLKPDDISTDRQARMSALGYPAEALEELTYYVGTLSCGDKARLDEDNPLTQQAYVTESGITVRPPDDQVPFTYVTATFVVAQVGRNGDLHPGSTDCPASAQMTASATWQREDDDSWTLLSLSTPEAPL